MIVEYWKGYNKQARIGRFTDNVMSPNFGKYYIDASGYGGVNLNRNAPNFTKNIEELRSWLRDMGYEKVEEVE